MWWALPVATTIMGMQNAQRKADQQRKNNLAQAEVTRYSPWTGMKGQLDMSYSPSALEGGLQGGVAGLGAAQGLQGAFGAGGTGGAAEGLAAGGMNKMDYAGANSLGGQDMASGLGQDMQFNQSPGLEFPELQKPSFYAGR